MQDRKFLSINKFGQKNGVPLNFLRKEVKQGRVPGFYSGTWFYIDEPAYLTILSQRNLGVNSSDVQ